MKRTTGYCNSCIKRTGTAKFRELQNGMCADCARIYPKITVPEDTDISDLGKKTASKSVEWSEEETKLASVFALLQSEGIGCHWRSAAADRCGWTLDKVKVVFAQLQKKGAGLVAVSIENQLLASLTSEFATALEIWEKFPNFKYDWIYTNLEKLAKTRVIEKQKSCGGKPNLYRLKEFAREGWCKTNFHKDGKRRFGLLTGGLCVECCGKTYSDEIIRLEAKLRELEESRDQINCEIKSLKKKIGRLQANETTDS
ncbi:MAG: hypothetical protein EAZ73_08975 [Oscillatoriales cyanobacterium]|uniref:hypothetical protein n=1 Tax=unclassified Microcoleus TaxID=2642155 RepID=UPI001D24AF20|nr:MULTISPECIES: hypothetical protein [unclassified Microcoleus]TAF00890.1 MAG: hypothetical protein EAZ79_01625 [Oscillatoriales cyanobacterium]MCC3459768.1 hypothetical protein [Microcoleus sp. PH2017_11_PCY_U_A]MCC3478201.1 hypothetical protein [Microcoleus sp. PH2017_12_PCY_D_A]TAF21352.1 MAG: hypothetical protein EAZ73_08975 [Oscillatoriales cyanobacterium]TAF39721.1 MAG: hypothetical protein EAZ69_00370 [Oscillatoriales cyanobacterium]